jgi:hypothetical protein
MTQDIRCITPVKVGDLHVEEILPILTEPQLTYATYLVPATWSGFPIACAQGSHEALKIHAFLSAFLMTHPRADLVSSISDLTSPLRFLIEFAAYFYQNRSNYTGSGDAKFTPRLTKEELIGLMTPYPALLELLNAVIDDLYSDSPTVLNLGFYPNGVSAYYHPADFTNEEQKGIDALLTEKQIYKENAIIYRESNRYAVKKICAEIDETGIEIGIFNGLPIYVTKGLYSDIVRKVIHWLR